MSESLEKQLRAALLILEVIEEYHNKELTFTQSCDLMGTIESLSNILSEPHIKYAHYDANKRQEIIHQFDLELADELIAAARATSELQA